MWSNACIIVTKKGKIKDANKQEKLAIWSDQIVVTPMTEAGL